MVKFDQILEDMGRVSSKQWLQLFFLAIPCSMVAMQMGAIVFLGHVVEKRCQYPMEMELVEKCNQTWTTNQSKIFLPEKDGELSECERYDFSNVTEADSCAFWWDCSTNTTMTDLPVRACTSWEYSNTSTFTKTIAYEFDLVCSEDFKIAFSQAIFMIGVTLGCIFWGQVADRYGRKFCMVVCIILGFLSATSVAFAPSFVAFVILRAITGFCFFASYTSAFVLGTEIIPPRSRVRIAQAAQAAYATGFCMLALCGYLVRDWRKLQLLISVPIFGLVIFQWITFESPRWLISNKKFSEARDIIHAFLKSAGDQIATEEVKMLDEVVNGNININTEKEEQEEEKSPGLIDLVRTPNMRIKSILLFYCWLTCACVYYGLTLNSADIGGDPFVNLALSGFLEIPAVFLIIPVLEKWGRRPTMSWSLVLAGISCVGMLFVPKELQGLNITLSMFGKFWIAAAFGTVYIFAAELYPTPIRNVGIGTCSSFARIGAILSPIIALLGKVVKPLPYVIFGSMSIIGAFCSLFLPEVLGIRLPETIQEGEEFGMDQVGPFHRIASKFSCCKTTSTHQPSNGRSPSPSYKPVPKNASTAILEENVV